MHCPVEIADPERRFQVQFQRLDPCAGRVLHEGRRTHGFGAELVARLTEENFSSLKAAPLRIGALDIPVPFAAELERAYRPRKDDVIERLLAWLE